MCCCWCKIPIRRNISFISRCSLYTFIYKFSIFFFSQKNFTFDWRLFTHIQRPFLTRLWQNVIFIFLTVAFANDNCRNKLYKTKWRTCLLKKKYMFVSRCRIFSARWKHSFWIYSNSEIFVHFLFLLIHYYCWFSQSNVTKPSASHTNYDANWYHWHFQKKNVTISTFTQLKLIETFQLLMNLYTNCVYLYFFVDCAQWRACVCLCIFEWVPSFFDSRDFFFCVA